MPSVNKAVFSTEPLIIVGGTFSGHPNLLNLEVGETDVFDRDRIIDFEELVRLSGPAGQGLHRVPRGLGITLCQNRANLQFLGTDNSP